MRTSPGLGVLRGKKSTTSCFGPHFRRAMFGVCSKLRRFVGENADFPSRNERVASSGPGLLRAAKCFAASWPKICSPLGCRLGEREALTWESHKMVDPFG